MLEDFNPSSSKEDDRAINCSDSRLMPLELPPHTLWNLISLMGEHLRAEKSIEDALRSRHLSSCPGMLELKINFRPTFSQGNERDLAAETAYPDLEYLFKDDSACAHQFANHFASLRRHHLVCIYSGATTVV